LGIHESCCLYCWLGRARTFGRSSEVLDFKKFMGEGLGGEGIFQDVKRLKLGSS